ncbi:polysaccharide deacetylase family protein [Desulfonatronum lacustre]|uniref:polysaccharide deacetylase family protein n=1 Tax=Desulfonatronum lacustre TaxID=66849 RepID=UPI00048A529B|nr:polysaccharide deacetylase family protein [Desulfonatronum lacustre]SMP38396.1 Polysaccharide deacetylase [Desulfonatronum zhilinae]
MLRRLRSTWEKNWPEIRCAATGSVPDFVLARVPKQRTDAVPVFCYHDVVGPELRQDLEYLRQNGYATLIADELVAFLRGEFSLSGPSVVLTFDDCSRSLFQVALPLLERHGCRAVAFAAPKFHDLAEEVVGDEHRPCTWKELRVMRRSGFVDVQSHSLEHRYFPRWPEPVPLCGADARMNETVARGPARNMDEDLRLAREILEARLGSGVRHLAFPMYDGTGEALRIGREVGYQSFWWGVLPGRPTNCPALSTGNRMNDPTDHIVRISAEFLRRLPGEGRISLGSILRARYGRTFQRWMGRPTFPPTNPPRR